METLMKSRTSVTLTLACFGAFSFWVPDILVHVIRRNSFDSPDVRIITLALPLISFVACAAAARLFHMTAGGAAIRMLPGIWLLGGISMALGASFGDGGFSNLDVRGAMSFIAISWVPIYTFMAATYDGSLFALLVVSTGLFLIWILPSMRQKS
jgi:hypothetical protein